MKVEVAVLGWAPPFPNSPYGLRGRKAALNLYIPALFIILASMTDTDCWAQNDSSYGCCFATFKCRVKKLCFA